MNANKLFLNAVNDYLQHPDNSQLDIDVIYDEETSYYTVRYNIGSGHHSYKSLFDADTISSEMSINEYDAAIGVMVEEIRQDIGQKIVKKYFN